MQGTYCILGSSKYLKIPNMYSTQIAAMVSMSAHGCRQDVFAAKPISNPNELLAEVDYRIAYSLAYGGVLVHGHGILAATTGPSQLCLANYTAQRPRPMVQDRWMERRF